MSAYGQHSEVTAIHFLIRRTRAKMADVFGTLFDAMVSTFQFVDETDGEG